MQNSFAKKLFAVGVAASTVLLGLSPFAASATAHTAGQNVSSSDGTVWMITASGTRRAYTSAGAFLSYGFNSWSQVVAANSDDLALPVDSAGFIPPQDGSIICSNKGADAGTCYEISGGQKYGFTSAAVFTGLGFSFSNSMPGDVSWMQSGPMLINSSTQAHLPGSLINKNGTVYLVGTSGLLGIPDLPTFNSWGYSFSKVEPANAADSGSQTGVMAMRVAGQLSPTGTSGGTTPPPGPGTSTGTGAATVGLASNNPAAGSVAKSAKAVFTRLVFTGGSTGATINSLVVTRLGLSSDSDVVNLYLYNDGSNTLLGTGSMNQGKITFTGNPLLSVPANTSVTVSVRADMAGSSTANTGDTLGYGIVSASDIPGVSVSGAFPVDGNLFTVASVTNLGALIVKSPATLASTVNSGTQQSNVGYFQFAGSNQPLSVTYIKFTNIGSISSSNIQNLKLMNGSTQVGNLAQLNSDNTVVFDLSGSPLIIPSGQTAQLWLRGDIMGGATRTFQFTVQRTTDVWAMDTIYNTGIVPGLATATGTAPVPSSTDNQVTINQGTAVLAVDTASPTGNIAVGATGVPYATFDVSAAGEDIRVSQVGVKTTTASTSGGNATTDYLTNARLVADATITNGVVTGGNQIGSTFNLKVNTDTNGALTTDVTIPGYWTVPAGTTHKLTVVADSKSNLAATLSGGTIHVDIAGGSDTVAQGANSLQSVTFGNSTGRTLSFVAGALTATLNSSLANAAAATPTGVGGQTGVRIGSYILTAGSGEGVNITLIKVTSASSAKTYLVNMVVKVNGAQVGSVQGFVDNSKEYSFTPNATLTIPAGGGVTVDVYADLISGSGPASVAAMTKLSGITATGVVDNSSVNAVISDGITLLSASAVNGQTVYVASSGSLNTTLDSASPTTAQLQQLPMGSLQQTMGVFSFQSTSTAENVDIQVLKVKDTLGTASTQGELQNCGLYPVGGSYGSSVGATPFISIAGGEAQGSTTSIGLLTFNMQNNPLVVPAGNNISVYVKCDVSTYTNATSADTHAMYINSASDMTVQGAMSGSAITSAGFSSAVTAATATLYRSTLTVALPNSSSSPYTSSPSGASSASATQNVAIFTLTNFNNAANQQITFIPTATEAGNNNVIAFTFNSTIVPTATARIFKLFKATDLSTAILAVTVTPSGTASTSTWSGTLTFSYSGGAAAAAWSTSAASSWTGSTSAITMTPQLLNSGATQEYVAQFDTTDAAAQKSFTMSLQTQGSNKVWYDGSADVSTLMTLPLTFGTLTY